jgi:oligopeptide transport system substrate-binding protein
VNVTNPLLSDQRLREAISLVIDRPSLVKNLLQGGQLPAYSLVPPCLLPERRPERSVNKKRAKELVTTYCEERGYSPQSLTFTIVYAAGDRSSKIAMAIQHDIKNALGIDVQLHPCDSKQFYARVSQLDYDMALSSWIADYFDPHSFYSVFERCTNGTNNTGWESLPYQSLVENSLETSDAALRHQCFLQIEQILSKELPIIPLFHISYTYVNEASVDGITVSPLGYLDIVQS